jgi:hypothetical protein
MSGNRVGSNVGCLSNILLIGSTILDRKPTPISYLMRQYFWLVSLTQYLILKSEDSVHPIRPTCSDLIRLIHFWILFDYCPKSKASFYKF